MHTETLARLVAGAAERQGERKVRAAQDTPLLKVEAIGNSRIRQKKTTAPTHSHKCERVRVRR